jgi:hypothetical protein
MSLFSRRSFLRVAATLVPVSTSISSLKLSALDAAGGERPSVNDTFPEHPPELVREMVLVSHFDLKRVREIVEARPALARAAWDWGFGDWEDALGAASHMGNRAIAEYLIGKGARPSLFSAAMLGQLEVVKAFISAQPGAQRIRGPHGISLLEHAKWGGAAAHSVLEYLQSLGDAGPDTEAPLSDEERSRILGTYIFGRAPNQQIDLTLEHNQMLKPDQLMWTRKGSMGRPLYHLGGSTFYPAGAPAVHIRFAQESTGTVMTVYDPEIVLTVRKREEVTTR